MAGQTPPLAAPSRHGITRASINEQQIGRRREQIARQSLAVAPQPVPLAPWPLPAMPLPPLQRDTRHPATALPDGRPETVREVLPCRYRTRRLHPNGQEHLAASHLVQAQPRLVILGQAFGVEHHTAALPSQTVQGVAVEARPHARGGQKAVQSLPHRNVLPLALRELVAVVSVRELAPGSRQGQDGDLHHLVFPREVVDQA